MSSSQSQSRGRKRTATTTSKTTSTSRTTASRNTRTYDRDFQQNLIDHGVYPYAYEYPNGRVPTKPSNWTEINQRLAQPRPSLSPSRFSEKEFKEFIRADAHAFKEKQVINSVIPIMEGKVGDGKCVTGDIPFNNLDHLTDGTIAPAKPDLFYGARPEQLDRRVRTELSSRIIPSTQNDLPMAPNFFLEAKGPDGSLAVAGRQACYDSALGARGIQSLQSYGESEPVYDNNAYTIASIYHGGTLKLYTSHPLQPREPGSEPEYYMNQLRGWLLTDNLETFRQGANAYRNSKDWAKEKRDKFIEAANGRAADLYTASAPFGSSHAGVSTSTTRLEVAESETSADELALDDDDMSKSVSKRARREPRDPEEEQAEVGTNQPAAYPNKLDTSPLFEALRKIHRSSILPMAFIDQEDGHLPASLGITTL
jgi:hypothetical protein